MKAIILAAGVGSRLRPITHHKPKTLVEVNGKPMLGYLIDNLIENDIENIVICTGYKSEKIKNFCISCYPNTHFTFVENTDYADTNNMYSLYLAKDHLDDDILLMNSDLVYEANIIKKLLKHNGSGIAVDKGSYDEESMKIIIEPKQNRIIDIAKTIGEDSAFGRSIDVYKFTKSDCEKIHQYLKKFIEENKELNQWTEVLLQYLFKNNIIESFPVEIGESKWVEIDNYEDLYYGELLFNGNIEKLKNKKVFLLDKDGTLTLGSKILDGANNFTQALNRNKRDFYLLSNNSSKTPIENLESFKEIGLENFDHSNFILSTDITIYYFQKRGINKIYLLANEKVKTYFKEKGFTIVESDPQAILLTYDTEINYSKLKKFHSFIKQGIPYYATHIDSVCPIENGDIPDIGSFIKLFQESTGVLPLDVFGKPSRQVLEYLKDIHNVQEEDIVLIGDRIYTDIEQKKYGNISTILTLTGEANREDVEFSQTKPDLIVKNLDEVISLLDF